MQMNNDYLIDNHNWIMILQMAVIVIGLFLIFTLLISLLAARYKKEPVSKQIKFIISSLAIPVIFITLTSPVWKFSHPFLDEPVGEIERLYHLSRGHDERLVAITQYKNGRGSQMLRDTNIVTYDPQTRTKQRIHVPTYLRRLIEIKQQYAVFLSKGCDYRVFDLWHNRLVITQAELTEKLEKFRCRKYKDGVLHVQTVSGEKVSLDMHMDIPMPDLQVTNLLGKHACTTLALARNSKQAESKKYLDLLRPVFLFNSDRQHHYSTRHQRNVCRLASGAERLRLVHHFDTAFGPGNRFLSVVDEDDYLLWTMPIRPKRSELKKIMARMVAEDIEVTFLYETALEVLLLDANTGELKQLHTVI